MYTASRLFRLPGAIFQPTLFQNQSHFSWEIIYFCSAPRTYIRIHFLPAAALFIHLAGHAHGNTKAAGINLAMENRLNYYIRRVTRPQWISLTRRRENYFRFFPVVEGPKHFRVTLIIYQHSRTDPFPFDNNYKKVHAVTRHSLSTWNDVRRH